MRTFFRPIGLFFIVAALSLTFSLNAFARGPHHRIGAAGQGNAVHHRASTGKTCGEIAQEAGLLEEFWTLKLETAQEQLDQQVKEALLTQQQADQLYEALQQHQAQCIANGGPAAQGQGQRASHHFRVSGQGGGRGLRDGSCRS